MPPVLNWTHLKNLFGNEKKLDRAFATAKDYSSSLPRTERKILQDYTSAQDTPRHARSINEMLRQGRVPEEALALDEILQGAPRSGEPLLLYRGQPRQHQDKRNPGFLSTTIDDFVAQQYADAWRDWVPGSKPGIVKYLAPESTPLVAPDIKNQFKDFELLLPRNMKQKIGPTSTKRVLSLPPEYKAEGGSVGTERNPFSYIPSHSGMTHTSEPRSPAQEARSHEAASMSQDQLQERSLSDMKAGLKSWPSGAAAWFSGATPFDLATMFGQLVTGQPIEGAGAGRYVANKFRGWQGLPPENEDPRFPEELVSALNPLFLTTPKGALNALTRLNPKVTTPSTTRISGLLPSPGNVYENAASTLPSSFKRPAEIAAVGAGAALAPTDAEAAPKPTKTLLSGLEQLFSRSQIKNIQALDPVNQVAVIRQAAKNAGALSLLKQIPPDATAMPGPLSMDGLTSPARRKFLKQAATLAARAAMPSLPLPLSAVAKLAASPASAFPEFGKIEGEATLNELKQFAPLSPKAFLSAFLKSWHTNLAEGSDEAASIGEHYYNQLEASAHKYPKLKGAALERQVAQDMAADVGLKIPEGIDPRHLVEQASHIHDNVGGLDVWGEQGSKELARSLPGFSTGKSFSAPKTDFDAWAAKHFYTPRKAMVKHLSSDDLRALHDELVPHIFGGEMDDITAQNLGGFDEILSRGWDTAKEFIDDLGSK